MERRIEEYEAELSEEELQRLKEYDQLIEDYDYRQGGYAGVECAPEMELRLGIGIE